MCNRIDCNCGFGGGGDNRPERESNPTLKSGDFTPMIEPHVERVTLARRQSEVETEFSNLARTQVAIRDQVIMLRNKLLSVLGSDKSTQGITRDEQGKNPEPMLLSQKIRSLRVFTQETGNIIGEILSRLEL